MRHLDLFSGIGGFALAASWVWGAEHGIVSFCEIDTFCQKVLKKHWPAVPCHDDIKTMKGLDYGAIDLLTGGFPCQPFSCAGKQRGNKDDRYLWPEMLRVIKEAKPRWIIGENVAGIVNMELDNCLSELESEGYETQAFVIPACAVDAPHRRDRLWIVADTSDTRIEGLCEGEKYVFVPNANGKGLQVRQRQNPNRKRQIRRSEFSRTSRWEPEPAMGELVNGISNRLVRFNGRVSGKEKDRVNKLKGLGNSILPQAVVPIMQAIKLIDG